MADKYCQSAGAWSTRTWYDAYTGGNAVAAPGAGDNAYAVGAVAIDQDITCTAIGTIVNATAGFTVTTASASRTVTANIVAGPATCLVATLHGTNILTILGDITGGSSSSAYGLQHTTTGGGKLNIGANGNKRTITGGSGASAHGVLATAAGLGNCTWYADIVGGSILSAGGASATMFSTNILTVNGDIISATGPGLITVSRLILNGKLRQTAADQPFPLALGISAAAGLFRWTSADGTSIELYDATNKHTLKVPEYPAVTDVKKDVQFDYTALTGTYEVAGNKVIVVRRQ